MNDFWIEDFHSLRTCNWRRISYTLKFNDSSCKSRSILATHTWAIEIIILVHNLGVSRKKDQNKPQYQDILVYDIQPLSYVWWPACNFAQLVKAGWYTPFTSAEDIERGWVYGAR